MDPCDWQEGESRASWVPGRLGRARGELRFLPPESLPTPALVYCRSLKRGLRSRTAYVHRPVAIHSTCATLGKSANLSVPWYKMEIILVLSYRD